ncbi:MAG: helix-turn-helix domain-containing protein [Paramuribaculum sp.]|nr:helix-turn-helix domain-containing protein [Paramuribaculum sp.]
MKNNNPSANSGSALRYGMFIPLAFMIASVITCCFSYSNAKHNIADDLNDAMFALANENSELWTRPDTIAAIRHMYETTHKPLIYQASDVNFRNPSLKEEAYFTLALVDNKNGSYRIGGNKIASDTIMLMPECAADGLAIQVQGFADCSMASIFYASDQTLPGILFSLSILSMASMLIWKRKEAEISETELMAISTSPSLDGIKLTPMQRQLTRMLLEAPGMKVDKRRLCESLWGNKSNAEESLYTLVKRTKNALAEANMEIVCNRGDSYELRINA